jgi:2-succinyl-5-enolpyruvyl-6-hydroxy-3-cyclohexene-1-carboxylate synthase
MKTGDINCQWARAFLNGLVHAGVTHFSASPGSRSTPLVLAAMSMPGVSLRMHVDERVAAFYALGQARATGRPAVVIATSGSAGAHFLPAVIEALQSGIPLLLLTADRPPEAWGTGANQTIDQLKLYGDAVRGFFQVGLPESEQVHLDDVTALAVRAALATKHPLPGPVHVNIPFRLPLEPSQDGLLSLQTASTAIPPQISAPRIIADKRQISLISKEIRKAAGGWIVCGPSWTAGAAALSVQTLSALGAASGFQIFCETAAGIIAVDETGICTGGLDFVCRMAQSNPALRPECIIEIGGSLTAQAYQRMTADHRDITRWVFTPHDLRDPLQNARAIVVGDLNDSVARLTDGLLAETGTALHPEHRAATANAITHWKRTADQLLQTTSFCEGHICRAVSSATRSDIALFVGNSLVIRDLDMFARFSHAPTRVIHQRGASGIDGLIAGAAGVCDALNTKTIALIGDMSARHDIGGLAALRKDSAPLLIVVVHNSGGRIFEQLPLGTSAVPADWMQRAFVMPDGPAFKHLAAAFDLSHVRVDNEADLHDMIEKSLSAPGASLIEAVVAQADSRLWRRTLDGYARQNARQPDSCR